MKQFRNSRYWVCENGDVFKHHPKREYLIVDKTTKGHPIRKQKYVVADGVKYDGKERWYKMKPTQRKNGYLVFNLQCPSITDKGFMNISVHQMVAECYIGVCPQGMVVDHIDNNRTNNHYTNLQYLTPQQNTLKNPRG